MKKEIIKRIMLAGICICAVLPQTMGIEELALAHIAQEAGKWEEYIQWLKRAAEYGNAGAQTEFGFMLLGGIEGEPGKVRGKELLEMAIAQGYSKKVLEIMIPVRGFRKYITQ